MNREELFKRTRARLNPDAARDEHFLIIGAGSGGARVAEETTRFGVGNITLVDRRGENLEEHNIIRHPLGYSSLGRRKVDALRERLLDINPECNVDIAEMDVVKEKGPLAGLIRQSTQVHLCTDNEASKHVVNELTVQAGVPLVFAGVFDGGCGGEVGRVMPGTACYACIAGFLNRSGRFDGQETETFDYSNPDNEQFRSTAALNVDIAQIALIQARVALLTMMEKSADSDYGPLAGNYILFGNRPVEGIFPHMLYSETWEVPKNANCLVCGSAGLNESDVDALFEDIINEAKCERLIVG